MLKVACLYKSLLLSSEIFCHNFCTPSALSLWSCYCRTTTSVVLLLLLLLQHSSYCCCMIEGEKKKLRSSSREEKIGRLSPFPSFFSIVMSNPNFFIGATAMEEVKIRNERKERFEDEGNTWYLVLVRMLLIKL